MAEGDVKRRVAALAAEFGGAGPLPDAAPPAPDGSFDKDAKPTSVKATWNSLGGKGKVAALSLAVAVAVTVAAGAKLQADSAAHERRVLDRQAMSASLLAEQVNATMVAASAALGAAAPLAGLDAGLAARSAAQARGVEGVSVHAASGVRIAAAGVAPEALSRRAIAAAGLEPAWAGVVRDQNGTARAAVTRRAQGLVLVALIDPAALLPPAGEPGLVALTDRDGLILARGAALGEGASVYSVLGAPDPGNAVSSDRVFGWTVAHGRLGVGVGNATGGLRVYTAAEARLTLNHLLAALAAFALMTLAPAVATSAALLMHSRRQTVRAVAAEQKLDRVQRHFRLAADGARAGVWTWRRDRDVIELSQRLQHMLNAPSDLLSLPAFAALATPEDRNAILLAFAQARESGHLDVAFRIQTRGKMIFVEARGVAIEEPGAEGPPSIVGTALDISARREAELRATTLERRLKEAVESFNGPFALFDHRRRLVMWNQPFARLFRLPPEALRPTAGYDAVMTAAREAIRRENHEGAIAESREIELHSGVWLQLVERRTTEGGMLLLGLDITPLKRQEEALLQKERNLRKLISELERSEGRNRELAKKYEEETIKAQEANRAKTSFLANMSHELRTPLNAVIGFSDMMAKEVFGPLGHARYREYAKDVQASGELLLDMINDILDTAKIEAGRMQLSFKPIDPVEPIDQAVRILRARAEQKKLTLRVDAEGLPTEIIADFRAVKQIVLNLLSNALKFTETGGVLVRARPHGNDQIVIQVIDTGPGIPKEHLPRLAQPFAQVDAELSRKHGGTGLGLSITKSLAELHGGGFAIESELGRGTVASIFLPREAMAQAEQPAGA